jgi:hypothetical protein
MVSRIILVFGLTLLAVIPEAAWAFTPVPLPEPAPITMIAVAAAGFIGAYFVKKWMGRK